MLLTCGSVQGSYAHYPAAVARAVEIEPLFDGSRALDLVEEQMDMGPRVPDTDASRSWMNRSEELFRSWGYDVSRQEFNGSGPDLEGVPMTNIRARSPLHGVDEPGDDVYWGWDTPSIIVLAHFDCRPYADQDPDPDNHDIPVPGANDGASGTAAVMELARVLRGIRLNVSVEFLLVDGEDAGHNLDGFFEGSTVHAESIPVGDRDEVRAVILLDMIGDAQLNLPRERMSTDALQDDIYAVAAGLGVEQFEDGLGPSIYDDHWPYLQRLMPAVDLIDFSYPNSTTNYWHTLDDTTDKLSAESLEATGSVVEAFIRGLAEVGDWSPAPVGPADRAVINITELHMDGGWLNDTILNVDPLANLDRHILLDGTMEPGTWRNVTMRTSVAGDSIRVLVTGNWSFIGCDLGDIWGDPVDIDDSGGIDVLGGNISMSDTMIHDAVSNGLRVVNGSYLLRNVTFTRIGDDSIEAEWSHGHVDDSRFHNVSFGLYLDSEFTVPPIDGTPDPPLTQGPHFPVAPVTMDYSVVVTNTTFENISSRAITMYGNGTHIRVEGTSMYNVSYPVFILGEHVTELSDMTITDSRVAMAFWGADEWYDTWTDGFSLEDLSLNRPISVVLKDVSIHDSTLGLQARSALVDASDSRFIGTNRSLEVLRSRLSLHGGVFNGSDTGLSSLWSVVSIKDTSWTGFDTGAAYFQQTNWTHVGTSFQGNRLDISSSFRISVGAVNTTGDNAPGSLTVTDNAGYRYGIPLTDHAISFVQQNLTIRDGQVEYRSPYNITFTLDAPSEWRESQLIYLDGDTDVEFTVPDDAYLPVNDSGPGDDQGTDPDNGTCISPDDPGCDDPDPGTCITPDDPGCDDPDIPDDPSAFLVVSDSSLPPFDYVGLEMVTLTNVTVPGDLVVSYANGPGVFVDIFAESLSVTARNGSLILHGDASILAVNMTAELSGSVLIDSLDSTLVHMGGPLELSGSVTSSSIHSNGTLVTTLLGIEDTTFHLGPAASGSILVEGNGTVIHGVWEYPVDGTYRFTYGPDTLSILQRISIPLEIRDIDDNPMTGRVVVDGGIVDGAIFSHSGEGSVEAWFSHPLPSEVTIHWSSLGSASTETFIVPISGDTLRPMSDGSLSVSGGPFGYRIGPVDGVLDPSIQVIPGFRPLSFDSLGLPFSAVLSGSFDIELSWNGTHTFPGTLVVTNASGVSLRYPFVIPPMSFERIRLPGPPGTYTYSVETLLPDRQLSDDDGTLVIPEANHMTHASMILGSPVVEGDITENTTVSVSSDYRVVGVTLVPGDLLMVGLSIDVDGSRIHEMTRTFTHLEVPMGTVEGEVPLTTGGHTITVTASVLGTSFHVDGFAWDSVDHNINVTHIQPGPSVGGTSDLFSTYLIPMVAVVFIVVIITVALGGMRRKE